jgi:hypothetical protein
MMGCKGGWTPVQNHSRKRVGSNDRFQEIIDIPPKRTELLMAVIYRHLIVVEPASTLSPAPVASSVYTAYLHDCDRSFVVVDRTSKSRAIVLV